MSEREIVERKDFINKFNWFLGSGYNSNRLRRNNFFLKTIVFVHWIYLLFFRTFIPTTSLSFSWKCIEIKQRNSKINRISVSVNVDQMNVQKGWEISEKRMNSRIYWFVFTQNHLKPKIIPFRFIHWHKMNEKVCVIITFQWLCSSMYLPCTLFHSIANRKKMRLIIFTEKEIYWERERKKESKKIKLNHMKERGERGIKTSYKTTSPGYKYFRLIQFPLYFFLTSSPISYLTTKYQTFKMTSWRFPLWS